MASLKASPREAVASICGVGADEERQAYEVDGLMPGVVAYPRSVDEVAAVTRLAAERGWAIIPRGGGSQWRLGGVPRAADIVLCTTDLQEVLEYEPADLTCTVQAGIRLADLQARLAEHGQFLALDPPLPETATIGGIIAANPSGPLRLRYGTCRDLLLGIKVVNPDGNVTKAGGKVVKNVTGYDMCKLYTGSLGTLGIIVEATFKLVPLPQKEAAVLASFSSSEEAFAAAWALYKSPLPIRACEILSPQAARAVAAAGANEFARPADGHLLAVWIGGGTAAVERQKHDVPELCQGAHPTTVVVVDGRPGFWKQVEDFGRADYDTVAKISVIPSATGDLLRQLPPEAAWMSHALSGVTYVFGVDGRELAPVVAGMKGYLVLERCPVRVKGEMSVWGPTGEDFPIMARIKREFDPDGILNPGRYVGGL